MKKLLLVLMVILGCCDYNYSQELYSIFPSNTKKQYRKEKLFFPKHRVKIKDGKYIYFKNKLIFSVPFSKNSNNQFEVFEDLDKNHFVIVTNVLRKDDIFAHTSTITRKHIYIIPLFDYDSVYYSNLNGLTVGTRKGYNLRKDYKDNFGILLEDINLGRLKIRFMIDLNGKEPYFKEFDIFPLGKCGNN